MKLELQRAYPEMEAMFLAFTKEWDSNGEEITPYAARLLDMNYPEWLDRTYKIENSDTCPPPSVSAHTYFLIRDSDEIIGAVNIRHRLNDYLFNFGGHIGYGVRPNERRKGYASKMLEMALPLAKLHGIKRALIVCDKTNVGSAKTIIKNGGILENEVDHDGEIVQRYWISL